MHIFQKGQVTLNKNAHNLQHHLGAQFFMLFHMVWFILFGVLGRETTFSLVEILQQPIRNFHFKVLRANTQNKMDHTMWKSMKNCAQKWCQSLCAFLFEATCAFGKMWCRKHKCWRIYNWSICHACVQLNRILKSTSVKSRDFKSLKNTKRRKQPKRRQQRKTRKNRLLSGR